MAETIEYASDPDTPADPIPLRRRLAAEAVGTFLLIFFGCGSMAVDAAYGGAVGHVGIGIVWGVTVMALIYALGDVGGAHFNPAVSFSFWLAGRFPGREVFAYSGVQIVAATIAATLLWLAFPSLDNLGQTNPHKAMKGGQWIALGYGTHEIARGFAFEVVLTFALVFVILCVAVGSKQRGLMAGIAIGGTVGICALATGPVGNASMNPARSIGPAIAAVDFQHLWIYCTAPFLGALVAVGAWTYIYRHPRPQRTVIAKPRP